MRRTKFASLSLAGLCLALVAAGCGGSADVTGSGTDPDPVAAAPASGNAALQGSLVDGRAGLRVDVVGTSFTAQADEEGQFALHGLPAGTVTLRFQGSGVDAQLAVPGLQDGKVTTIEVEVSGSSARLPKAPTCTKTADTFFTGTIESIEGTTFLVDGRTVDVSQLKKVWRGPQRISLDDLTVGEKIKVWGQLQADGIVIAEEIALMAGTPGDDGTSWAAFTGIIEAISGTTVSQGCVYYPALVVSGQKVVTSGGTSFIRSDGSSYDPAILKVGDKVYVEGWKRSDGAVYAKVVRL